MADLRASRARAKKTFMDEFEVNEKEYETDIYPLIRQLSKIELADLLKSKKKRNVFLAMNLRAKTPDQRVKFNSAFTKKFQDEINTILASNKVRERQKERLVRLLTNIDISDKTKKWDGDIQVAFQEII